MNKDKRYEIFRRWHEDNPHPKTELNFSSPFELLVAVTLSAQSTDKGVNKATDKLFKVANTPQAIVDLGLDSYETTLKPSAYITIKQKMFMQPARYWSSKMAAKCLKIASL